MHIDANLDNRLSEERALCVYRTVQECLNNIARHARASTAVHIDIREGNNMLAVAISNQSPPVASVRQGSGMGLRLLAERLRAAGGELAVEALAERFTVRAILPL